MIAEATPQSVPILRAVGILNLLVGGALLLCGGSGLWLLGPTLAGMSPFGLDPFLTREVVASLRDQMIEDEKAQGLQVTDPALKERMRKSREALESTPRDLDKEIDFAKINACLPWLSHYLWVEVLSAPILNLLLTLSGIGLIASKPWGRKLAIWTSRLKLARLALLCLFLVFVVVPQVRTAVNELARAEFGRRILGQLVEHVGILGLPSVQIEPGEFVRIAAAMGYIYALMSFALGAIFPVVVLVILTRSRPEAPHVVSPVLS